MCAGVTEIENGKGFRSKQGSGVTEIANGMRFRSLQEDWSDRNEN
jgi:hypothetical protein